MNSTTKPQPRVPVLVALHADGYVEVFAESNVSVRIVQVPYCRGIAGEIVAQDFTESLLPPQHKRLYFPGLLRATGNVETVTPDRLARRNLSLGILQAANRIQSEVTA